MADRRLQVFTTVARLLSFTKAADVLHMTQPAVTFQIRQLEEYFNTRLFDRTHNRIALTAAGELVKSYGDRIIAQYSEMDNEIRKLTGDVSGPLIIGASTTIGEYVVPGVLGDLKRAGAGGLLHARGQVDRVAHGGVLAGLGRADLAHDHGAGVYADPQREIYAGVVFEVL